MKKTSYKDKLREDLAKSLVGKREELSKWKFGTTGSKTRNIKEGKNLKKDVARIMTEINRNKE